MSFRQAPLSLANGTCRWCIVYLHRELFSKGQPIGLRPQCNCFLATFLTFLILSSRSHTHSHSMPLSTRPSSPLGSTSPHFNSNDSQICSIFLTSFFASFSFLVDLLLASSRLIISGRIVSWCVCVGPSCPMSLQLCHTLPLVGGLQQSPYWNSFRAVALDCQLVPA